LHTTPRSKAGASSDKAQAKPRTVGKQARHELERFSSFLATHPAVNANRKALQIAKSKNHEQYCGKDNDFARGKHRLVGAYYCYQHVHKLLGPSYSGTSRPPLESSSQQSGGLPPHVAMTLRCHWAEHDSKSWAHGRALRKLRPGRSTEERALAHHHWMNSYGVRGFFQSPPLGKSRFYIRLASWAAATGQRFDSICGSCFVRSKLDC
jgi:hypothetical protein